MDVLVRMGYGGSRKDAGEAIGQSGDEGIDGIIKEDRLGLDIIYIQARRWENTVGRPEVQRFAGALQGRRARKGVFITTSTFSREAVDYAGRIDTKQPVAKVPAAFERRCIPHDCVVRRLHMPNMRPPHALSGGRLAALCATRGFTTGCKVILITGQRLAELMIDHGVGVRTDATYELKRIDADYFPDE